MKAEDKIHNDLTFFTNEPGATILDRFRKTLKDAQFFDMLVGYFRTSVFSHLYKSRVIIDFCDLPIFDATTYPSIILSEKILPGIQGKALAATFSDAAQFSHLEQPEVLVLMEKLPKAGAK
jgi:hypothetical protein